MERIRIFVLLVLTFMGSGATWIEPVDAAETALSKAIFFVG